MSTESAHLIHYSILIEWSDEDGVYVVTLPEWGGVHTHGATYEEALRMARELIDLLIDMRKEKGEALPQPRTFSSTAG